MLVVCETKSHRVKGLSFHPKLPWLIASLHNGIIQLWDYRIKSLIDTFEEHEGPVRGVDFHISQPLFVSGGDDYRIKLWNYKLRKCIFTLLGHLDYIRTVQFHHEYPWILSASDDQTVRIWNWQNRSCIAVLTGHNHYVMCAQFHQSNDFIISASLDQTLRMWDFSGLREKTASIKNGKFSGVSHNDYGAGNFTLIQQQPRDLFGTTDVVCKFILEGHDRGVNWASFHPTVPLIASGADDRLVKLWRYNDSKWWEVETFRGHFNNVSSVIFHPTKEFLISNSEDRTIKVWDITKKTSLHTFRRENDRFWALSALRGSNLLAVGHDSGVIVFKLNRERPIFQCVGQSIYYLKDNRITVYDCVSNSSLSIIPCRIMSNAMCPVTHSLVVNPFNQRETNILITYNDSESWSYDLFTVPKTHSATINARNKQGFGKHGTFFSQNQFAIMENNTTLSVHNLSNEITRKLALPVSAQQIFLGGANKLLLKSEQKLYLFDIINKAIIAEVNFPGEVKEVVWSTNNQHIAIIGKCDLMLVTSQLIVCCSLREHTRIKGGAWNTQYNVFLYSTLSTIKYCLINGDYGIFRCTSTPLYIVKVDSNKFRAFERGNPTIKTFNFNCIECFMKSALNAGQLENVSMLIKNGKLCGNSVISYLRKKGHPDLALQLVSDTKTRLTLAIEDGDLGKALKAACQLSDEDSWRQLASEAMLQGNFQIAELSYQKIKDFEKLSFLYFISGNLEKLRKMNGLTEVRNDVQSRLNNALYLGDVEERIKILAEVGQIPMAAFTAKTYNLDAFLKPLSETLQTLDIQEALSGRDVTMLRPPLPLKYLSDPSHERKDSAGHQQLENWPSIELSSRIIIPPDLTSAAIASSEDLASEMEETSTLQKGLRKSPLETKQTLSDPDEDETVQAWEDLNDAELDLEIGGAEHAAHLEIQQEKAEERDQERQQDSQKQVQQDELYQEDDRRQFPGESILDKWSNLLASTELSWTSNLLLMILCGKYFEALVHLKDRIGLINPDPLMEVFEEIREASFVLMPLMPLFPAKQYALVDHTDFLSEEVPRPMRYVTLQSLDEWRRECEKLFRLGQVPEALSSYRRLMHRILFCETGNEEETKQLRELLDTVKTYLLALTIETERKIMINTDPQRNVELATLLSLTKVKRAHKILTLKRGMGVAYKLGNHRTAARLATRLIAVASVFPESEMITTILAQATKIASLLEKNPQDRYPIEELGISDFDHDNSLIICTYSIKPIKCPERKIKCLFCSSEAKGAYSGKLCQICLLSKLAEPKENFGLQF